MADQALIPCVDGSKILLSIILAVLEGVNKWLSNAYPKVSIIVAAYNSQETIEECLKSILALELSSGLF